VVLRHLHFLKGMEHAQSDPVEIASTLQVALNKLDSRTKMAVILKYMEEYSYQEISQMMSLPEGSVKSMVSRGLSKIEG